MNDNIVTVTSLYTFNISTCFVYLYESNRLLRRRRQMSVLKKNNRRREMYAKKAKRRWESRTSCPIRKKHGRFRQIYREYYAHVAEADVKAIIAEALVVMETHFDWEYLRDITLLDKSPEVFYAVYRINCHDFEYLVEILRPILNTYADKPRRSKC
eukprot:Nk52_evm24s230 gene=Nk52_evmTU24s230